MIRPAPWLWSAPHVAIFTALACCPTAAAQPAKPLTLAGKLTRDDAPDPLRKDSRHKVHELELTRGRAYLIELSSTDFDTYLRVEDGDGTPLAENDDAGPDNLNSRLGLVPTQTGKYRAVVTSFKGGQTGAYRLTVHELERVGAPLPVAGKLTKESPKNQGRHYQTHGIKLSGGVLYLIEMEGTGFTPSLLVGDARGLLVPDLNRAGAKRARAVFVPEAAGMYRLTAVATKPGAMGAYWITVQAHVLPESLAAATAVAGEGAIQPIQGRLTADDPRDRERKGSFSKVHEVKLEAGQKYVIDLTSREFDTYLRLEDKDGKILDENDDVSKTDLNSRLVFTPTKSDTYRLVVTTYDPGKTGAYRLSVRPLEKVQPADEEQAAERERLAEKARALHAAGVKHRVKGEHAAAARLLGEAVTLWRDLYPKEQYPDGHLDLAKSLNSLGVVFQAQGKLVEAHHHCELALTIQKKVLPADHPHLAASLNNLGLLLQELGRRAEARPLLEQALDIFKKVLPADHPDLAQSLNNLGMLLRELGRLEEARPLLEQALDIDKKVLPADHPHLAISLNSLGLLLRELGRGEEARPLLEQALDIDKKVLPADHPELATSLGNLGVLLSELGRREEARPLLEQALEIQKKVLPPDHSHLARSLNNLGNLLSDLGRNEEARPLLEQAITIRKKVLPADHPQLATSLNNLGALLLAMGRFQEARPLLEQALAIRKKVLPADHPNLAQSLNNLGMLLRELGRLEEARLLLEQALDIDKKVLPADHPLLAVSLNNLGTLLRDLGRREEARPLLEQALAICKKVLPADHPDLATSLNSLGALLSDLGRREEARLLLEQALAIHKKALPADHPHLAASLNNLGGLLWSQGERDAGWPLLADAVTASTRYLRRMATASAQRHHAPLLLTQRVHLDLLCSAALTADSLATPQRQELLLRLLDAKGISTAALAGRRDALLEGADPKARALADELLPLQQRLADLLLQGPGKRPPQEYRKECDTLQRRIDELEGELGRQVQAIALQQQRHNATPEQLADRLPLGAVLIETVRFDSWKWRADPAMQGWASPRYAAVLLGAGVKGPEVHLVDLGEATPLEQAIASWRAAVQAGKRDAGVEKTLRERLWAPLAKVLPEKTTRLIVAPDGALAQVPFEAIPLEKGEYLIERYAVQYVSTGRDLMPLALPKERSEVAVVLADPDYQCLEGGGAKGAAGLNPAALRAGLAFQSLPGFAREADAVAKLLQGHKGWRVEQARGADASEERLAGVKRPRLLHCITHGFFLEDVKREPPKGLRDLEPVGLRPTLPSFGQDPRLRSGLALAGANKWRERSAKGLSDGLLTALEVENLDLWGTELVVLSACDTGRGEIQVGEGVLGLRRAFQLAGAQTVLASLWKVPDAETEQLLTDTLSRWLKGVSPAEALREAQLAMIRRLRASGDAARGLAPPLYWAAFICHGR